MKRYLLFILIALINFVSCMNAQNKRIKVTIGTNEFTATLNDNETVNSFLSMLPLEINMTEMGGYEKYYYLPQNLPGSASNVGTTYEGDLMIWSSNCLVLFYTTRQTSYNYIRLGRIDDTTGLRQAVGSGNISVKFEIKDDGTGIEESGINKYGYRIQKMKDYLEVSGEFEKLTLFNLNGNVAARSEEKIIHTGNLPSGVYLLKIDSENKEPVTMKIIKE